MDPVSPEEGERLFKQAMEHVHLAYAELNKVYSQANKIDHIVAAWLWLEDAVRLLRPLLDDLERLKLKSAPLKSASKVGQIIDRDQVHNVVVVNFWPPHE